MALRGSASQSGLVYAGTVIRLPFPVGTLAGDLAIFYFITNTYIATGTSVTPPPSGWTVVYTGGNPVGQTFIVSKVLTSGDIVPLSGYPNGHVELTLGGFSGGSFLWGYVYDVAVLIGSTYTIRELDTGPVESDNATISPSGLAFATTTSAVISGDGALYFGSGITGNTVNNLCMNRGKYLQSDNCGPTAFSGYVASGLYYDGFDAAGPYTIGFGLSGGASGNGDAIVIIIEGAGFPVGNPAISCGSPPNGTIGDLYSHAFPTQNLSCQEIFSITSGSLPPVLTLDASTGVVSGYPTALGIYPFTIQVIYGNCADSTDPIPFGPLSVSCSITITKAVNNYARLGE